MKFGLFLAALLFQLSVLGANSHSGPNPIKRTIQCRILDASTGEALTGVQVSVGNAGHPVLSDEDGNVTIEISGDLEPTLTCSLVSFTTLSLHLTDLTEEAIIYLEEK